MMLGLEQPTHGEIFLLGADASSSIPYRRIGYCPQFDTPLFENMSVLEHLKLYGRLKCGHRFSKAYMGELLEDLDLLPYSFASNPCRTELC